MTTPRFICRASMAALLAAFTLAPLARGAVQTWNNAGPTDAWDTTTAGNWTPGPFVNGDSAIFGGAAETIDVDGSVSASGLTFNTTGYTIADPGNDGTLTLAAASTITLGMTGTATITVADAINAGSFTITRGAGLTGTATFVLSGANNIAGTITINTATGSSTILMLGANNATTATTIVAPSGVGSTAAQFVLNGFSTTVGGINISGNSTRRIAGNHATNLSVLTLEVAAGVVTSYSSQIGNGTTANANRLSIVSNGPGLQEFTNLVGSITYFGDTVLRNGSIAFAPQTATPTLVNGPGSSLLILDGGVFSNSAAATFTRTLGSTPGANAVANTQFQMTANGGGWSARGGTLTVNLGGAGAAVDWGVNVGVELVGPLKFGHASSNAEVMFANPIHLNGDARVFDVAPGSSALSFATIGGAITDGSGPGTLLKTGNGTLKLAGVNAYTGTTVVAAGTLSASAPAALPGYNAPGIITVNAGAALQLRVGGAGEFTVADLAAITTNATFNAGSLLGVEVLAGNTVTLPAPLAQTNLGLRKDGAGDLVITAANTYTGGTNLALGALRLGNNAALGTNAVMLGAATLSSDGATARTLGNGLTINANPTLGDAVNTGVLTLAGPVDFAGGARNVTVASAVNISGAVSNGRITQKFGPATLTFSGPVNMNGAFEIREGAAVFHANAVTLGDAVRVMANLPAGNATFTMTPGSTLLIANNGANFRVGHDSATITDGTNIASIAGAVTFPAASTAGSVHLGSDSALARVNLLAGGSITARSVGLGVSTPAGAITEFNFDGGTLRAFVSNAAFFDNVLTAANVKAGGGTIDTNGFDITIAQPLLHDPALGATPDGGLTKMGNGTLRLTGAQTYAELNADGGTTALRAGLGTGGSILNVDALANTNASQKLAALNIGPGGVFTIDSTLTAPVSAFAEAASGATAVPEPGGFALLLAGLAPLLGRRLRHSDGWPQKNAKSAKNGF